MTSTVAVLNQKGGVGKTTVTLGLASAAWSSGLKTLVVDLDAQANATFALGVDPSLGNLGTGDAIRANRSGVAGDMIVQSGWGEDIWLLPAAGDLTEREADTRRDTSVGRLARALEGVTSGFDVVLIDCAPSLGLNTSNGLAAADAALLVVEPTTFGLRGVEPALDLIEDIWSSENRKLDLAGVVLNRVPAVSTDAQARVVELNKMVGTQSVWKPAIPPAGHRESGARRAGSDPRIRVPGPGTDRRVRRPAPAAAPHGLLAPILLADVWVGTSGAPLTLMSTTRGVRPRRWSERRRPEGGPTWQPTISSSATARWSTAPGPNRCKVIWRSMARRSPRSARSKGPAGARSTPKATSSPPASSISTPTTTARPPGITTSPRRAGTASPPW